MAAPLRNDLTADYVRRRLHYDPFSGNFRWRRRADIRPGYQCRALSARYAGMVAGPPPGKRR